MIYCFIRRRDILILPPFPFSDPSDSRRVSRHMGSYSMHVKAGTPLYFFISRFFCPQEPLATNKDRPSTHVVETSTNPTWTEFLVVKCRHHIKANSYRNAPPCCCVAEILERSFAHASSSLCRKALTLVRKQLLTMFPSNKADRSDAIDQPNYHASAAIEQN